MPTSTGLHSAIRAQLDAQLDDGRHSSAAAADGFDVTVQGTAEAEWRRMLEQFPFAQAPSGSLIVVALHPDDEILGAGGLIQLSAARLQSVRVISVTGGEASHPGMRDLKRIRARELRDALACVSPAPVEVCRLKIPDGAVTAFESRVARAIDERVNHQDILVAPYERDGHPDHDAVGRACRSIARRRNLTLLRYPIWAWHHASLHSFHTSSFVRIALTQQAQKAKRHAIECFGSQLRAIHGIGPILPDHVLNYFSRPYEAFLI